MNLSGIAGFPYHLTLGHTILSNQILHAAHFSLRLKLSLIISFLGTFEFSFLKIPRSQNFNHIYYAFLLLLFFLIGMSAVILKMVGESCHTFLSYEIYLKIP